MQNSSWKKQTALFLSAQTISLFGSALVQYAIIWKITLDTSSGVMLTLSTLCGYLPQIAISLFAGVWLDRSDRKRLMMLSDALIAAATAVAAICFAAGQGSTWLLLCVLAVRSAGAGIQTPAVNAMLPQLVPQDKLVQVNGANGTLSAVSNLLAPALGATVLAATSIGFVFLIDIVTAIIGLALMTQVHPVPVVQKAPPASALSELRAGLTYLRERPMLRHWIVYMGVVLFLVTPTAIMLPLLIERNFAGELWQLAVAQMTFSLGMALGGVLVTLWGGPRNRALTIVGTTIFYGLLMSGLGLAANYWVFLGINFLIGWPMTWYSASATAMIQQSTDPAMQGRVFGVVQLLNASAFPLGTLVFGPLADRFPLGLVVAGAGVLVILYALCSLRFCKQAVPPVA